jgi:hypothetical protein
MGFLDKAKTMASQAAERAKEEAKELNLKRQINNEEEALGAKAFELIEQGALAHADLDPHVARIRELKAELETIQAAQKAEAP